jgi:hypothetical protein
LSIKFAAIIPVWAGSLIAGLITGVGVKAGVEPSEEGIGLAILEAFCKATEEMPNGTPQLCWTFYGFVFLLSLAMFGASVLGAIVSVGNWKVGGIIYAAGFIPGILLVLGQGG